jgi:hypothetical protein
MVDTYLLIELFPQGSREQTFGPSLLMQAISMANKLRLLDLSGNKVGDTVRNQGHHFCRG